MTRVNFESSLFPSLEQPKRAHWCPVFISPIRGSPERLIIAIAVANKEEFHLETANALFRLRCVYGIHADIIMQAANVAIAELKADLQSLRLQALMDFRPTISGITVGDIRAAEGASLEAIGAAWMSAMSCLYSPTIKPHKIPESSEEQDGLLSTDAFATGDRLPNLVCDYVSNLRQGLRNAFRADMGKQTRRNRSHEIAIHFNGSRLVANFGTLRVGHLPRSIDLIKRRMWD